MCKARVFVATNPPRKWLFVCLFLQEIRYFPFSTFFKTICVQLPSVVEKALYFLDDSESDIFGPSQALYFLGYSYSFLVKTESDIFGPSQVKF